MGECPGKGAKQPSDQPEQFPIPKPVMTGLGWHRPDSGTDRRKYKPGPAVTDGGHPWTKRMYLPIFWNFYPASDPKHPPHQPVILVD